MTKIEYFSIFLWICGFLILSCNAYLGFKTQNYPAICGWVCSLFLYVTVITK